MSQPIQPQQQQPPHGAFNPAPPPPIPPQGKPPKRKRFGFLAMAIVAFAGLTLGSVLASVNSDPGTATPAPTATRTITEVPGENTAPTEEPTQEPTKAPAKFSPKTSDFQVNLKITSKQCFGSAGCIIDFEPKLAYKGTKSDLPDVGLTSVTYQVSGGEDEFTDTLTVDGDGSVTGAGEQTVDTAGPSRKLVAKVTGVEYNEFG